MPGEEEQGDEDGSYRAGKIGLNLVREMIHSPSCSRTNLRISSSVGFSDGLVPKAARKVT
jgi:hypothetical protein